MCIQLIEHHAGFDRYAPSFRIDIDDIAQIFTVVNHQRSADGLPALRGSAAAWQDRNALLGRKLHRTNCSLHRTRHNDADRHDLINRRVRCIAAA